MAVPADVGNPTRKAVGVRVKEYSLVTAFLMCLDWIETFWLDARYQQQATVAYGINYNQRKKVGLIFRSQLFFFF